MTHHSKTHGHTVNRKKTAEYQTWLGMWQRCGNPRSTNFKNYGGRGIKVCERWQKFENFIADMGRRPSAEHSIERKDHDGDYCSENCVWATRVEQNNNSRHNVLLTHNGKTQNIMQWSQELGMSFTALWSRINVYKWPLERALTEKQHSKKKSLLLTIDGVTKTALEWAEFSGTKYSTVYYRHQQGWSDKEAVYGKKYV